MSLSVCCPPDDKSNAITPTIADFLTVRKGMDLEGNSFWEIRVSAHGRVRRRVTYKDRKRDLVDYKLPRTVYLSSLIHLLVANTSSPL